MNVDALSELIKDNGFKYILNTDPVTLVWVMIQRFSVSYSLEQQGGQI